MEDSVRERINCVFTYYNFNPNKLSGDDRAMQKRLSRQIKGGATITFDTISSILDAFPNVSSDWLLKGLGVMLKEPENPTSNNISQKGRINTVGNISVEGNYTAGDINHNINLVLPEKGHQKIINYKGNETTIEVENDNVEAVANLLSENRHLKNTISELRERIKVKDELLESKEEIINMYKLLKSVDRHQ